MGLVVPPKQKQVVATEPKRQNSSTKKPSVEAYILAERIAAEELSGEKNQTLKQYYINLMDQLEIEGFPKYQISTIGKQIVIEKKCEKLKDIIPKEEITIGSWWYDVAKEKGCIDPHYSHPNDKDDEPKDKPKPKTVYEQENNPWITQIERMEDFLRSFKAYLRKNHFHNLIPKNESAESLTIIKNVITHCEERFNDKQKISPSHYPILIEHWYTASGNALSIAYYKHVRKKEAFVEKQYRKVARGLMKNMTDRYEPNSPEQAESCGYCGVPCPNCDNLRTDFVPAVKIVEYVNPTTQKKEQKTIQIRKIHCYKEDIDHEAPMPDLPAAQVSTSDW